MKTTNSKLLQKTLTFAATISALGASVGVPPNALGRQLIENTSIGNNNRAGAVQAKIEAGSTRMKEKSTKQLKHDQGIGASQMKFKQLKKDKGVGANQLKIDRNANTEKGPTQNNQLPAGQLPGIQR
jgi:uncharacterized protein YaiL (DUF2058 family)